MPAAFSTAFEARAITTRPVKALGDPEGVDCRGQRPPTNQSDTAPEAAGPAASEAAPATNEGPPASPGCWWPLPLGGGQFRAALQPERDAGHVHGQQDDGGDVRQCPGVVHCRRVEPHRQRRHQGGRDGQGQQGHQHPGRLGGEALRPVPAPPLKNAAPSTRSTLPRTEPTRAAWTTEVSPERRAKIADEELRHVAERGLQKAGWPRRRGARRFVRRLADQRRQGGQSEARDDETGDARGASRGGMHPGAAVRTAAATTMVRWERLRTWRVDGMIGSG